MGGVRVDWGSLWLVVCLFGGFLAFLGVFWFFTFSKNFRTLRFRYLLMNFWSTMR